MKRKKGCKATLKYFAFSYCGSGYAEKNRDNPKVFNMKIKEFKKIGSRPSFSLSFNLYASILGPVWFGMRNIWNWALTFLIIETFSVVQIIRGLFGNITAEAVQKIEQVQSTIAFRNKQLEAAITNNPDKVDVYKRNIKSLEDAMQGYIDEVSRIEASAIWITIFGIVLLVSIKIVQGDVGVASEDVTQIVKVINGH